MLEQLDQPERVLFFDIEPNPAASRDVRAADRGAASRSTGSCPTPSRSGSASRGLYVPRPRATLTADPEKDTDPALSSLEQARRIAALAQEKLAEDVVILDMRPVCTFTDYFVIATGRNPRQTAAIWDEVHGRMKHDQDLLPRSIDGKQEGTWILADYLDVVLHVFTPEARDYYKLEELWNDVPAVELETAAAG